MPRPEARPAETIWGKALEILMKRKGLTLGKLSKLANRERSQIYKIRFSGTRGPTADLIDDILSGLEMTWHDWAEAYEAVKAQEGTKKSKGHHLAAEPELIYQKTEHAQPVKSRPLDASDFVNLSPAVLLGLQKLVNKGASREELADYIGKISVKQLIPGADLVIEKIVEAYPEITSKKDSKVAG